MTIVQCPTCRTQVEWKPESRFRPFCSERCKQIDLGAWASERYAIGSDTQDPSQEDSDGPSALRSPDDGSHRIN